ncbi:MAG: hypothetical protein FWC46_05470 [Actinomycetia bacterium]|nr:hypothetical protein [Actinomycetes bacterium]
MINYLVGGVLGGAVSRPPSLIFWILMVIIWVAPSLVVAIAETRVSHSTVRATLAGALVWLVAVVGYYMYYALTVMFDPSVDNPGWIGIGTGGIVDNIAQWGIPAIICGAIVGFATATVSRVVSRKNLSR